MSHSFDADAFLDRLEADDEFAAKVAKRLPNTHSRRGVLLGGASMVAGAATALGATEAATGEAAADPQGSIGTASDPVQTANIESLNVDTLLAGTTTPQASSNAIRLGNSEGIAWRGAADNGDGRMFFGPVNGFNLIGPNGNYGLRIDTDAGNISAENNDLSAVGSLSAEDAGIGAAPSKRPIISNGDKTLYLDPNGGDDNNDGTQNNPLQTLQEAFERAPLYLRHAWDIDLTTVPATPVTYDEDVKVPTHIGTQQIRTGFQNADDEGPQTFLRVIGDSNTPSNVEIGSLSISSVAAASSPQFIGFKLLRENPFDDESAAISVYSGQTPFFRNIEWADGITHGIAVRDATIRVRQCDFDGLSRGISAKSTAIVRAESNSGDANTPYEAGAGTIINVRDDQTNGDPSPIEGGIISDDDDNAIRWGDGMRGGRVFSGYVDESANRTDGVWYQNTDEPLDVKIILEASADNTDINASLHENDEETDRAVEKVRGEHPQRTTRTLSATIPRYHYYKIELFGDTADYAINDWFEQ